MELPLAYFGDPVLRKKTAPIPEITDEIRKLAQDMVDTMRACNGIGLAAPQIHRSIAIFVTEVPIPKKNAETGEVTWENGPVRVFINPKIMSYSEEEWTSEEGCLSIPGIFGPVTRPVVIKVQATDLDGKVFTEEFKMLDARCIMHENDHINGVLFIDRVQGKARTELEPQLRELKKKNKP